jgi:predicted ribosomally synthesized peptide with nif11-like leader
MSKEHAHKFMEQIQKDEALRKKVREASEHVLKVAKDHGFDVTREDLKQAAKARWKDDEGDDPAVFLSETPGF